MAMNMRLLVITQPITGDYQRLPGITGVYRRLPVIAGDNHGFPWITGDYPGDYNGDRQPNM
jgi:hypothetical protein